MSALLPIKESVRALILDATTALQPHFSEITAAWRKQMFAEFEFEGRAMAALERLNLATGFALFSQSDFAAFFENLNYFGTRLAKLQIDTRAVARSLEQSGHSRIPVCSACRPGYAFVCDLCSGVRSLLRHAAQSR